MCHSVQILNANINLPCRPQRPGVSDAHGVGGRGMAKGFRKQREGLRTFQRRPAGVQRWKNRFTRFSRPCGLARECEFSRRGGGEQSNYNTLLLCFLPLGVYIRGNGACSLRPVDSYEIFFISISLMTVARRREEEEEEEGGFADLFAVFRRATSGHLFPTIQPRIDNRIMLVFRRRVIKARGLIRGLLERTYCFDAMLAMLAFGRFVGAWRGNYIFIEDFDALRLSLQRRSKYLFD